MRASHFLCLIGLVLASPLRDTAASPEWDATAQLDPFVEAVGFWAIDDAEPFMQFMFDFEFDGKAVFSRCAFDGGCACGDMRRRAETQWFGDRLHMRKGGSWEYLATFRDGRFVIVCDNLVRTYSPAHCGSRKYWLTQSLPLR
jgi:hypothetical protein